MNASVCFVIVTISIRYVIQLSYFKLANGTKCEELILSIHVLSLHISINGLLHDSLN